MTHDYPWNEFIYYFYWTFVPPQKVTNADNCYVLRCNPEKIWLNIKLTVLWPLRWRHNERDSVSNHQPHDCLLNRLFRRRSKKSSKLRVTGLCVGNSPGTGEFPAQMASYAGNVSIWWRHHDATIMMRRHCKIMAKEISQDIKILWELRMCLSQNGMI